MSLNNVLSSTKINAGTTTQMNNEYEIELEAKKIQEYHICLEICKHAHRDQKRWNGEAYWNHPKRIADTFWKGDSDIRYTRLESCNNITMACVSLLHDVLEDCAPEYTLEVLSNKGIPHSILWPVVLLTKLPKETYHQYLRRLLTSNSFIALNVKVADIMDNCGDLIQFGKAKWDKIDKYMLALEMIKASDAYPKARLLSPGLFEKMEEFLLLSTDITKVSIN